VSQERIEVSSLVGSSGIDGCGRLDWERTVEALFVTQARFLGTSSGSCLPSSKPSGDVSPV
jgi:hypothetical protein